MRLFIAGYVASLIALAVLTVAGGVILLAATAPDSKAEEAGGQHAFNFVTWELRHFPQRWLYDIGSIITDHKDGRDDDEIVARYFTLLDEVRSLDVHGADPEERAATESELANLEGVVEDIIEGRVTSVLEDEGLTVGLPPFTDMEAVFPPVDFELDTPPRLLVVSPRDRIARGDSYPLTPGLDLGTVEAIEADVEIEDGVSALIVQTGGVSTYPSIVSSGREYTSVVDTVFHEWLHQYLIMYPLGRSYFSGDEARTLNESVASIAGRELAVLYLTRYGDPTRDPEPPSPSPAPSPDAFDFREEMRSLRLEVEELLDDGRVQEAESLMSEKRDEFEVQGVYIRRINQAYFAFYGSYADTPASIDPIGPGLEELLLNAGSPGEFVRQAYRLTSRSDLEQLLDAGSG